MIEHQSVGSGGGGPVSVGLVVVSHSAKVAEGVVELAGQMAGDVRIKAAGGTDDGGIGTDATLIAEAIGAADEAIRGRVRIAEAPVVEGAVVAAIQASTGSSLEEVDRAARDAATMVKVKGPG